MLVFIISNIHFNFYSYTFLSFDFPLQVYSQSFFINENIFNVSFRKLSYLKLKRVFI